MVGLVEIPYPKRLWSMSQLPVIVISIDFIILIVPDESGTQNIFETHLPSKTLLKVVY